MQGSRRWIWSAISIVVLSGFIVLNLVRGNYWFAGGILMIAVASALQMWGYLRPDAAPPALQNVVNALSLIGFGTLILDVFGLLP